jgi:hypothetical protein
MYRKPKICYRPTYVEVFMQGYLGSDPQDPDVLCTQTTINRVVSFWYYSVCLCIKLMMY